MCFYQLEICDDRVPCFDVRFDDDAVVTFSIVDSRPELCVGFCCLESTGGGGKFRWKSSIMRSIALLSSLLSTSCLSRFDAERWISEMSSMTSFVSSCNCDDLNPREKNQFLNKMFLADKVDHLTSPTHVLVVKI
jgi:hypothetical protein